MLGTWRKRGRPKTHRALELTPHLRGQDVGERVDAGLAELGQLSPHTRRRASRGLSWAAHGSGPMLVPKGLGGRLQGVWAPPACRPSSDS